MSTAVDQPSGNASEKQNLTPLAMIIIFGIFATTLPQPQVLGRLPLTLLLKNELHCTKEQVAQFFFLCGLFWYLKPLAGILTDAFPLFKTRRRWYLIGSAVLAAASWLVMGLVPHSYTALLLASIIVNLFMVMASTVVGAILVEAGQRMQATGRLTSLRMAVQNVCTLINGPLAGFLAGGAFMVASGVSAALVFAIAPIAWIYLREKPVESGNTEAFKNAGTQLSSIFRSKTFFLSLFFIVLFYFSPGFSTPLLYRQQDELKFSVQFMGNLGIFSGAAGILAALLYSQLVKRLPLRALLFIGVATAAGGTLFYLLYNGPTQAILIDGQNGFFFTLAELAIMDLAARAVPKGAEGMGYGMMLALRNAALFGADMVGSALSDNKWPFADLVYLNAGTTAIVLILIPFLPAALMRGRDSSGPTHGQAASRNLENLPQSGEGP